MLLDDTRKEPLVIRAQGSISVGGETVFCAENDGGDPDDPRFAGGHIVVNQVFATYQYPAMQRYAYPVVFNPGGGHSARVYDTTPDGREGWLTLFLRAGFATYGVDRVNSGRSGNDIRLINRVRLKRAAPDELPVINRYSFETAWKWFRWGPTFGEAYPDTQFPLDALEAYYPQLVPTYRDPEETEKSIDGLTALFQKIGPATLQTWSSAGLIGYRTAARIPGLIKGILAVESSPTAFKNIPESDMPALSRVPMYIVIGDRAPDRVEASRGFAERMKPYGGHVTVDVLPEAGIRGNGHTLMLEKNNDQIMTRMVRWLDDVIYHRPGEA